MKGGRSAFWIVTALAWAGVWFVAFAAPLYEAHETGERREQIRDRMEDWALRHPPQRANISAASEEELILLARESARFKGYIEGRQRASIRALLYGLGGPVLLILLLLVGRRIQRRSAPD